MGGKGQKKEYLHYGDDHTDITEGNIISVTDFVKCLLKFKVFGNLGVHFSKR